MSVKSREELLNALKVTIGDSTEESDLNLLEDFTDTLNDYEEKNKDKTDWKSKYEENDNAWKKRYKERFFNDGDNGDTGEDDNKPDDTNHNTPKTFADLFKTE
jgi:hypothetical protein